MSTTSEFRAGEKVFYGRTRGEKTLGEVIKVNPSRIKVKQLEARGVHPVGTIWNVAPSLCSKAGSDCGGRAVEAPPAPKRPEADIMREINGLYNSLSPENLTCDGEIRGRAVLVRARGFRAKLQACFRELGRTVSEDEAYRSAPRSVW